MNTFDEFAKWFTQHDKRILESHTVKDRAALQKSLKELEIERNQLREYHDHLEHLVETARQLKAAIDSTAEGES